MKYDQAILIENFGYFVNICMCTLIFDVSPSLDKLGTNLYVWNVAIGINGVE